jgi:hypothetical protein
MSTTLIIVLVSIGLFALVAVAFTLQIVEKNNRERRQRVAALKAQARDFDYMLEGFPAGFLNRDLRLLVCQCLADAYTRIGQLDRRERSQLAGALSKLRTQRQQLADETSSPAYQAITDTKKIKEIQELLNLLANLVSKLQSSGRITAQQADLYVRQIRRLLTRSSVDAYRAAAAQALESGKPRLAAHYHGLAVERMSKDNSDGFFTEQIPQLRAQIAALEQQDSDADVKDTSPLGDDWDAFDEPDDAWKKKALYD